MRLPTRDGGNAVRLSETISAHAPELLEPLLPHVIPEVCYRGSSFKHLDCCLEHGGMTEGVKRRLYPIQQIILNKRALVALCLG
ncbi:MAG: hypothetical protein HFP77_04430 [Methylococcales symbiont of Iophon sp. n. MRB-2018]|nr:MAG: hypothetical protein HFP77_04430 [Methylococcales symbiont of Iophon sp. n. MRB-2018]KAF3980021.1 MAG: hypothetical protein HFP76_04090 [Methylococcales symbiont of Iophon sp. n. MRB-2018]